MASSLTDEDLLNRWDSSDMTMAQRDDLLVEVQKRGLFPSSFVDTWENDTGAYPEYQDPLFLQKLYGKREIIESYQSTWKPTTDPCRDDAVFETTAVQRFAANLMSPRSPYMSMLLYHGVGVGKTCAAVQIAEAWLKEYPQEKVFLIAPPTIQSGFYRTIFDVARLTIGQGEKDPNVAVGCTGNTYLELTGSLLERDKEAIERDVMRAIRRRYNVFGYYSFAGYIERLFSKIRADVTPERRKELEQDILRHHFSGKLVIIDEAHNLRDIPGEIVTDDAPGGTEEKESASAGKLLTPLLDKVLEGTEGMKLVLLSATPMYNNYREIIHILNLLLKNDKKATLSERDVFLPDGTFTPKTATNPGGADLIGRVASRYVSFMRGENPVSFPIRLFPKAADIVMASTRPYPPLNPKGSVIPEGEMEFVRFLPIVAVQLKGDALAASLALTNRLPAGTTELTNMDTDKLSQAGTFIAPAPSEEGGLDAYETFKTRLETTGLDHLLERKGGAGGQELYYTPREEGAARFLGADMIGKYSPKFELLLKKLATCQGVAFIYMRFVSTGALPLALALEANGYTLAPGAGRKTRLLASGIQDGKGRQCAACALREVDHAGAGHPFRPAYYGLITGDERLTPKNKDTIAVERAAKNKDGFMMKVVIGSQIASEGVDFRFVRETHVLDSWYHLNKTEQVIGRAIRFCSHSLLDSDKRNTTIYLYATYFPDNERETADLYSYRRAFRKAVEVGRVSRELKVRALDCNLNRNAIVIEGQDPVTQIDSQGLVRPDVNINDMPASAVCDWVEDCSYSCVPHIPISNDTIFKSDDSTYSEYAAKWRENNLKSTIRKLFQLQPYVSFERLWHDIFGTIPLAARKELFAGIVANRMFRVEHKGIPGYVRYCNGYYVFQPDSYADVHIPMAVRVARAPVRRDSFVPRTIEAPLAPAPVAETATAMIQAEEGWTAIVRWVLSMKYGSPFPALPEPVTKQINAMTGSDVDLINKYNHILEMIQWFHISYYKTMGPSSSSSSSSSSSASGSTGHFHQTLLEYIWDNWFTIDDQIRILYSKDGIGSEFAWDMVKKESHNLGRIKIVRLFDPKAGDIRYVCDNGIECAPSIVASLKADKDHTDPLRKLAINKESTGEFYGFMALKKKTGKLVFKTKNIHKRGQGAECSIVSTTSEQHAMIINLGKLLTDAGHPDLELKGDVIVSGPRKIANATRACAILELVMRFMDLAHVSRRRWFFRAVSFSMAGE